MKEIIEVFLNPHGRNGEGLTPGGWKEPQKGTALCSCADVHSEDPGEQSFLSAMSDPDVTKDSI